MDLKANQFDHITILTGAGISAESGINTFRDSGGLWENYRLEDVATPEAYLRDPMFVWKFYSMRRIQAGLAQPNLAHEALANFAARLPQSKHIYLITQNVDVLHARATESHRLEPLCMHGSLNQSRCTHCGTVYFDDYAYFDEQGNYAPRVTPLCDDGERATTQYLHHYRLEYRNFLPVSPCCQVPIRPHVVWFGEVPLQMEKISRVLQQSDLFVSIGTSGQVYPAAAFAQLARNHGATTVCINMEPIPQYSSFDLFLQGRATQLVPEFFSN